MKESLWSKKIKKIALENSDGFVRSILSNMKVLVSTKFPTVCVINDSIVVNPYFCSSLSKDLVVACINHEIQYILFTKGLERRTL